MLWNTCALAHAKKTMVVPKPNYICELEKKQVAGTGLARWHRGIGKKPKHSAAVLPTTLASLVIFKKKEIAG